MSKVLKNTAKSELETSAQVDSGFSLSVGNVYADIGVQDADAMLVKAQLCAKIQTALDRRDLNQRDAAKLIGMPQAKLSNLLRGDFRGISESKMLKCLVRLGHEIKIVIKAPRHDASVGHLAVV